MGYGLWLIGVGLLWARGNKSLKKKKKVSHPWDQGPRVQLLSHVVSLGLSEFTCGCGRTRDIPPSNAWVIHLFLTSLPEFGIITNFFKSRSGSSVVRACCMFRLHLADGSWRWTPFHSSTWQLCSFLGDTTLSVHFLIEYFKMLSFQSLQKLYSEYKSCLCNFYFFFLSFCYFFGPLTLHMEVPRLGVESVL